MAWYWPRHVEHILAKLGAGRRTEIASWVAMPARATAAGVRVDEPRPSRDSGRPRHDALSIGR